MGTVDGSVILDYNKERYLAKMASSMTDYDNMRTLEEEKNDNSEGKFDLSVMVLHELPTQSSGNIFCLSSSLLSFLTLIMLMVSLSNMVFLNGYCWEVVLK